MDNVSKGSVWSEWGVIEMPDEQWMECYECGLPIKEKHGPICSKCKEDEELHKAPFTKEEFLYECRGAANIMAIYDNPLAPEKFREMIKYVEKYGLPL